MAGTRAMSRRPKTMREALYQMQRGCCYLCGRRIRFEDTTKDHVFPRYIFRDLPMSDCDYRNVLLAHPVCNNEKADYDPNDDDYMALSAINIVAVSLGLDSWK